MNASTIPVLAGVASTLIFASSTLPMLVKARRTRDLASYSLGNICLSNLGNAVHSVYVFSLPPGPIWVLHTFYVGSTALMLFWYFRYGRPRPGASISGSTHRGGGEWEFLPTRDAAART